MLNFIKVKKKKIKNIIKKAYECGAKFVFSYGLGVTLRKNQREQYFEQLRKKFPQQNLDETYMNTFGEVYENQCQNVNYLWTVFKEECEKYNILYKMEDIIDDYKSKYERSQISWF